MTFMVTIDWFVYLYWLIEGYVNMYCMELNIRNQNSYFDRMSKLQTEVNPIENVIEFPLTPVKVQEPVPVVVEMVTAPLQVELDESSMALLQEMSNELQIEDCLIPPYELSHDMDMDFDCIYPYNDHFIALEQLEDEEDDSIHMNDLVEQHIQVATGYEEFASAKILDCLDGAQQWVVQVVGIEEDYIHVSDGKRIWINIGERVNKIRNNDVLILDVIRNGKNVSVENLFRLEANVTDDYLIPDEHQIEYGIAM
jgi:hypothetical protein